MSQVVQQTRAWFGPITFTRSAIASGVATTAAMLVPVTAGYFTGRLALGLDISLGALVVALADTGGSYRIRARWMLAATLLGAIFGVVAGLAGNNVWLAAPLGLLLVSASAMLSVYGNEATRLGTALAYTVVIMASIPITEAEIAERFLTYVAGGLFAMLFTLMLWPIRPLGPAARAVSDGYRTFGSFVEQMARLLRDPDSKLREWEVKTQAARSTLYARLDAAREITAAERSGRAGASPATERMVELTSTLDRLYRWTLSFSDSLALLDEKRSFAPARGPLADHFTALANGVDAFSNTIRADGSPHADPDALQGVLDTHLQCCMELRKLEDVFHEHDAELAAGLSQLAEEAHHMHDLLSRAAAELLNKIELEPQDALAVRPRQNWRAVWATLRANLSTHSTIARHALRVGVAVMLGIIVYSLFDLEHGYWITFAIVAVMKPDVGGSQSFIAKRVTATVIGGIIAALLVYAAPNVDVMLLMLVPIGLLSFTLISVNYRIGIIFFTMFIVLLVDLGTPGDWQLAALRILNTVIGGTIALAASYLLWPTWQRTLVPGQIADAVAANRAYLGGVLASERKPAAIRELGRHARITDSNTAAALQKMLSEPRSRQGNSVSFYALVTHIQRITIATTALDLQLSLPDTYLLDLAAVRDAVDATMLALEQAIRAQQPAPDLRSLDAAHHALLYAVGDDTHGTLALSEIGRIMDAIDGMVAVTQAPQQSTTARPSMPVPHAA
jgi:uncharacterized membrane protein YccC